MAENNFYISVWLHFLYVLVATCRQAMRKQIERQEENQGNQGIEFPVLLRRDLCFCDAIFFCLFPPLLC